MAHVSMRYFTFKNVALLALSFLGVLFLGGMYEIYLGFHSKPCIGHATDYAQLKHLLKSELHLSFFPPNATNIDYWYRPHGNRPLVIGEFDMTEKEFLKWAATMNWQIGEIKPTDSEVAESISSGPGEDPLIIIDSGYAVKMGCFKLYYDKQRNRAFFQNTSFVGIPRGTKET